MTGNSSDTKVGNSELAKPPVVIDGRFELESEVRHGGMAEVYRASDLHDNGSTCALKLMKAVADERLAKESFLREYRGLELAQHRHVVRLIAHGIDEDHKPYIAMEWLDKDLLKVIRSQEPMRWIDFWRLIGQPLLEAITWAQSKNLIHRDIKPQNILMTEQGEPKLCDYGISRIHSGGFHAPLGNATFRDHGSPPFTPPEPDDGIWSFTRDGFSWAVVAISCLTSKIPANHGEVVDAIRDLESAPIDILLRACSLKQNERPENAALLLADIETWMQESMSERLPQLKCCVFFKDPVLFHLGRVFGPEERDVSRAVLDDFNELARVRSSGDDGEKIRIIGDTWQLVASRDNKKPGILLIEKATLLGSAEAERQRALSADVNLALSLGFPQNTGHAQEILDEIFALAGASEYQRAQKRGDERERILRIWQAYLRARSDFETGRGSKLKYSNLRINDKRVTLTINDLVTPDLLGQDRMIRTGQKSVSLEVTSLQGDEVTLRVTYGDQSRLPAQGTLEVNTQRALSAIDRQRQALDAVAFGRAVNPDFQEIVLEGRGARPPLMTTPWTKPRENFDADKVAALRKALGVQDILAIEGPPGTGKTRLIEEIISQYLDEHPDHRVLLSSQTHAALDNVLDRLAKRSPTLDMVRVGRFDNDRIATGAAKFLLERKAEAWSLTVAKLARSWLEKRAQELGVDAEEVRAGALAVKLAALILEREALALELSATEELLETANSEATRSAIELDISQPKELRRRADTAQGDAAAISERLASIGHEEKVTRDLLSEIANLGSDLAKSDNSKDLEEFAAVLLGDSPEERDYLKLMRLQEEWLERVGRTTDFFSAMLASAKVVASTCVALTGVRGINEVAFDLCIVDEASKATATEILVPMSRSRRSVLVGDPRQLPPFFERAILDSQALSEFSESEVRENVFDRLLRTLPDASKVKLSNQYRMVRPIGELVSTVFYDGLLESPKLKPEISFPQFTKLVTWLDTALLDGNRENRLGTSWSNLVECQAIRNCLAQLNFVASNRRGALYDIAIIAGYQAQVRALEDAIRDQRSIWTSLSIRINTVDAFQGSEADVCIYSVVRSNDRGDAGFLSEPPRLNVALSRARSLLLIVGDYGFCSGLPATHPMRDVVRYIEENGTDCEVRQLNDT